MMLRVIWSWNDVPAIATKLSIGSLNCVRNLEPLLPGETEWLSDRESRGTVVGETSRRSYSILTIVISLLISFSLHCTALLLGNFGWRVFEIVGRVVLSFRPINNSAVTISIL